MCMYVCVFKESGNRRESRVKCQAKIGFDIQEVSVEFFIYYLCIRYLGTCNLTIKVCTLLFINWCCCNMRLYSPSKKEGDDDVHCLQNSTSIEFHGYNNLMLIGRGLPTNFFFFQYFTKITLLLNFHQDLLKTTSV